QQTLTVLPKSLILSGASAANKVYDRTAFSEITGTLNGIINGDQVSFTGNGTFNDVNVADGIAVTASILLTGTGAGNYSITQPTGLSANITPKALTISGASAQNKEYTNTTDAIIMGTLVGIIAPDEVILNGVGTFSSAAVADNIPVTSNSTLTGASADNYTLTQPTGLSANITRKTVTLSGLSISTKEYDQTNSATIGGIPVLAGVLPADQSFVSVNETAVSATFNSINAAANIPVTLAGTYTLEGTAAGNYLLTQPTGFTGEITKKAITILNPVAVDKIYNGTLATTISGSLDGVITPDVVTLNGTGNFDDANAGNTKPVTSTSTLGGADAGNYSLTQPTGLTANISKADQTITFNALANKLTTDAAFNLTATTTSGLAITYNSSNPLVASVAGNTVTIAGAGTTVITASQGGDGNYNAATSVDRNQLVTVPPVTIAAWEVSALTGGNANYGPSPFTASTSSSDVTVVGLTRGSGIATTGSAAGSAWGGIDFQQTSAANAITGNDFVTFKITPNAGKIVSLSSIPSYNIRRSGTGPTTGKWQYQVGTGSFVDLTGDITWGAITSS
ncbi:MAG: beta strand repeat-containing protein, partial [Ferruginibacter sp.]